LSTLGQAAGRRGEKASPHIETQRLAPKMAKANEGKHFRRGFAGRHGGGSKGGTHLAREKKQELDA